MADDRKNTGQGNFGNPEQHAEAGRKGGQKTSDTHDEQFYSEIGREGGKASSGSFEKGSQRAKEEGAKGGRASGNNASDGMDEAA